MTAEVIKIGDVTKAWLVKFTDENDEPFDISNFTCKLSVAEKTEKESIMSRDITLIHENQFVVFLTDAETNLLKDGCDYLIMVQLSGEDLDLPKPIKKTHCLEVRAATGFID